jgi:hypothetical protein
MRQDRVVQHSITFALGLEIDLDEKGDAECRICVIGC